MYNSHDLAIAIKETAKQKNVIIKTMLQECGLGTNTMSSLYHGKSLAFDSLARIADYLECSVDYLLGRVDTSELNADVVLNEPEKKLLVLFNRVNIEGKEKIIEFADDMVCTGKYPLPKSKETIA
ncbi:MAG: helix-turn-helix transcriptional regulator [Clostridiales bacterium]|nr:helix-turn-helix transcriptional regulator [Clostridiales bacterium]